MICFHLSAISGLMLCLVVGCGSAEFKEPVKVTVEGSVLLDDKPLAEGSIIFAEEAKGLTDHVAIKDGKFSGQTSPGDKKVMITAQKDGPPLETEPDKPTRINFIPPQYNQESKLKANVPSGGTKGLEFKVTSE